MDEMGIQDKLEKVTVATIAMVIVCFLLVAVAGVVPGVALASGPRWQVALSATPHNLAPGSEGQVVILATNVGTAPVKVVAPGTPVTVTIHLPSGLTATKLRHEQVGYLNHLSSIKNEFKVNAMSCTVESGSVVTCTWAGELDLPKYETL